MMFRIVVGLAKQNNAVVFAPLKDFSGIEPRGIVSG
jgi:hypothetical protein